MSLPLSRPKSRSLAQLLLVGAALLGPLVPLACKGDGDEDEVAEPPTLAFVGAQNEAGALFELDAESISLSCGTRLTLKLGPSDDSPGVLDDWYLRGPGACAGREECGYLSITAVDGSGDVLIAVEQAVVNPVLELGELALDDIAGFEATLISGETGEPFLVEESPVKASWDVTVTEEPCDAFGFGGGGGAGGASAVGGAGGQTTTGG